MEAFAALYPAQVATLIGAQPAFLGSICKTESVLFAILIVRLATIVMSALVVARQTRLESFVVVLNAQYATLMFAMAVPLDFI